MERAHRAEDREQLTEPAEALEERGADRREWRVQHAEPLTRHHEQALRPPELVEHGLVMPPRAREGEGEQGEPHAEHDREARVRPVRHLRGRQRVRDQQQGWNEVEQPVGEDGSDQRRPGSVPAGELAGENADPRQLADPPG